MIKALAPIPRNELIAKSINSTSNTSGIKQSNWKTIIAQACASQINEFHLNARCSLKPGKHIIPALLNPAKVKIKEGVFARIQLAVVKRGDTPVIEVAELSFVDAMDRPSQIKIKNPTQAFNSTKGCIPGIKDKLVDITIRSIRITDEGNLDVDGKVHMGKITWPLTKELKHMQLPVFSRDLRTVASGKGLLSRPVLDSQAAKVDKLALMTGIASMLDSFEYDLSASVDSTGFGYDTPSRQFFISTDGFEMKATGSGNICGMNGMLPKLSKSKHSMSIGFNKVMAGNNTTTASAMKLENVEISANLQVQSFKKDTIEGEFTVDAQFESGKIATKEVDYNIKEVSAMKFSKGLFKLNPTSKQFLVSGEGKICKGSPDFMDDILFTVSDAGGSYTVSGETENETFSYTRKIPSFMKSSKE